MRITCTFNPQLHPWPLKLCAVIVPQVPQRLREDAEGTLSHYKEWIQTQRAKAKAQRCAFIKCLAAHDQHPTCYMTYLRRNMGSFAIFKRSAYVSTLY